MILKTLSMGKQPMLRFGYHLLFRMPIPTHLQEKATQNPQLVRENPPFHGQIIILLNLYYTEKG